MKKTELNTRGLNLLIPKKKDAEREAVATAFTKHGGIVHRLDRFWDPPEFAAHTVRVYGPDSFCLVLQQKIHFPLHSPPLGYFLEIPPEFLKREKSSLQLKDAPNLHYPVFIKSRQPKQFRAAVYHSSEALQKECAGLSPETPLLVVDPVNFVAEVRCFILNQEVLDSAVYEGPADIAKAHEFAKSLTEAIVHPRTVVVDIGFIPDRGWAVVEFNDTWGSGLNGCDAEKVLPAIVAASSPWAA